MRIRPIVLPFIALASLGILVGCQAMPSEQPTETSVVDTTDSLDQQATATDSESPEAVGSIQTELPAGVAADSNEGIAWEALMGPDGEYAAAASYLAVIDEFGPVEPYSTIKQAEERHIGALIRQLQRYGIDVPDNPYLGQLDAPADLETAAAEWAVGEIANVEMYDGLIKLADDPQLIRVLENLRRASLESHLPAFEAAAENGGTLEPGSMPGN